MSRIKHSSKVKMILIGEINILNPRVRNKKIFSGITENISGVGLKKPITVTTCKSGTAGMKYDLVCGQGRLEAFVACGQTHIPAIIVEASEEQALIMSLVENCARRQHRPIDLLHGIEALQKRGYEAKEIAEKTGLTIDYVFSILRLMARGEERLLSAVESGQVPVFIAAQIADTPDEEIQRVLQELYETKQLRGRRLMQAKKLIELRMRQGKSFARRGRPAAGSRLYKDTPISAHDVMKVFKKEVDRKRYITNKAEIVSNHLIFVTTALKRLFKEEHFNVLLQAEKLHTLPKSVSDLMEAKGQIHG